MYSHAGNIKVSSNAADPPYRRKCTSRSALTVGWPRWSQALSDSGESAGLHVFCPHAPFEPLFSALGALLSARITQPQPVVLPPPKWKQGWLWNDTRASTRQHRGIGQSRIHALWWDEEDLTMLLRRVCYSNLGLLTSRLS